MSPTHNLLSHKDNGASAAKTGGGGQSRSNSGSIRLHFVAALGEFVGTFMFLFFGYAGHFMVARSSTPSETDTTTAASLIPL
ncbi:hypothetical protein MCOR05_009244 [Pyricularia oryzae]|nr:hypothetical protein MCOR05_009244 [Pyricularia oryzae]